MFAFLVFGILDGDDVFWSEGVVYIIEVFTRDEIKVIFFFFVELLDCFIGVDVSWGFDADNMCVLGEHFIADGVFVLIFFILGPVHLH